MGPNNDGFKDNSMNVNVSKRKPKAVSAPYSMAPSNNGYPIYSNPVYQQSLLANNGMNSAATTTTTSMNPAAQMSSTNGSTNSLSARSKSVSKGVTKPKQQRGRKPKNTTTSAITTDIGVDSNYNSPYTPMESPLGPGPASATAATMSDKSVKKPVTRKKRAKKNTAVGNNANMIKEPVSATAAANSGANGNIEFMDHFAEATFLTTKPYSQHAGNTAISQNMSDAMNAPFDVSMSATNNNNNSSNTNTAGGNINNTASGNDRSSGNTHFVQKTNNIDHKNDIVESLMNGDDFGLNFLPMPAKRHGDEDNNNTNNNTNDNNNNNNTNDIGMHMNIDEHMKAGVHDHTGVEEDILLKSFLLDDDNFAGLDFNLDHQNTDINNS